MLNYNNYKFSRLYNRSKKSRTFEESILIEQTPIQRRYLKPRIDFTSTKKKFEYRPVIQCTLQNLRRFVPEYFISKNYTLEHTYLYFRYIIKKKKPTLDDKRFWYRKYNNLRCLQVLFFKNKVKKKFKKGFDRGLTTLHISQTKFNIYNVLQKSKIFLKKVKYYTKHKIGYLFKRYFISFLVSFRQLKILISTYRVPKGTFWALVKELSFFIKSLDNIKFLYGINILRLLKKISLLIAFTRRLLKITYKVLKKSSRSFYYIGLHFRRFMYKKSYVSLYNAQKVLKLLSIKKTTNIHKILILDAKKKNLYVYFVKLLSIMDMLFVIFIKYILRVRLFSKVKTFIDLKISTELLLNYSRRKQSQKKKPSWFFIFLVFLRRAVLLLLNIGKPQWQFREKVLYRAKIFINLKEVKKKNKILFI